MPSLLYWISSFILPWTDSIKAIISPLFYFYIALPVLKDCKVRKL